MKRNTQCPKCKGTGQVELSEPLAATLCLFKGRTRLRSADVKAKSHNRDISLNAFNNQLETLREAGLLSRERDGKWFKYFLTPQPKK